MDIVVVRSAGDAVTVDVKALAGKTGWPVDNTRNLQSSGWTRADRGPFWAGGRFWRPAGQVYPRRLVNLRSAERQHIQSDPGSRLL